MVYFTVMGALPTTYLVGFGPQVGLRSTVQRFNGVGVGMIRHGISLQSLSRYSHDTVIPIKLETG